MTPVHVTIISEQSAVAGGIIFGCVFGLMTAWGVKRILHNVIKHYQPPDRDDYPTYD